MKFSDFLNESVEYKVGDVVTLYSHTHGVVSGEYGKFNIEKITNTMIYVYDHNEKNTIKFNKKTKREIGDNSSLIIGDND